MRRESVYYVVETKTKEEDKPKVWIVSPSLSTVKEETRTVEEIERAACDKGAELMYCSAYSGISSKFMDELEEEFYKRLLVNNKWDFTVDPRCRITFYSE
jgi:hypothetical protein